jgi:hypothetical protein
MPMTPLLAGETDKRKTVGRAGERRIQTTGQALATLQL